MGFSALQAKPPYPRSPDTHQIPGLQHAHEGTKDLGLRHGGTRNSGWSGYRVNSDRGPGPKPSLRGLVPGCRNGAPREAPDRSLLGSTEEKSPGTGRGRNTRDSCSAWGQSSLVEGTEQAGHRGLPGHKCGDRWGLQDDLSPDTKGTMLWAPPELIGYGGGGVCAAAAQQTPLVLGIQTQCG